MERKRLIRPITILKVRKYLEDVIGNVLAGSTFSLDELARSHSISGSNATALLRLGWIMQTDVKFQYTFSKEKPFDSTNDFAKKLIEEVRVHNANVADGKKPDNSSANKPSGQLNQKDDHSISLKQKTLISPEIASVLSRVETALNVLSTKNQIDIFDGISNVHNERVHVASAIASGIYSNLSQLTDSNVFLPSNNEVEKINNMIIFATSDLMDKILNFKK